jgi:hypothetical protein
VQAAAQAAGVSESTAFRRVRDPEFRRQLERTRADILERAVGHLADSTIEAAVILRQMLHEKATPPAVRLGVARSLIELGTRLRESTVLEQRLTALEAKQAEGGLS